MKILNVGRDRFEGVEILDDNDDNHANKFWKRWNKEFDMNIGDMTDFLIHDFPDHIYRMPFTIEENLQKQKNYKNPLGI